MNEELRSMLLGTLGLDLMAVMAVLLTVRRGLTSPVQTRLIGWFVAAIVAQGTHLLEEFVTGFHVRFPAVFGLEPWSDRFFLTLNLLAVIVWLFCVPLLRRGFRPACFPVWLLAIASLVNALGHPLLALRVGGYFPGLWTSPLVGLAGFFLWRRLWLHTTTAAM